MVKAQAEKEIPKTTPSPPHGSPQPVQGEEAAHVLLSFRPSHHSAQAEPRIKSFLYSHGINIKGAAFSSPLHALILFSCVTFFKSFHFLTPSSRC